MSHEYPDQQSRPAAVAAASLSEIYDNAGRRLPPNLTIFAAANPMVGISVRESESARRRCSAEVLMASSVTEGCKATGVLEDNSIYASREGILNMLLDNKIDRISTFSQPYQGICAFLTYKPFVMAFYPISLFICTFIAIASFYVGNGFAGCSPSLLTIALLANYMPILHAKVITGSFLGQSSRMGNPFRVSCSAAEKKKQMSSTIFTEHAFAPGKPRKPSLYRLVSSIISFNHFVLESNRFVDDMKKPLVSDDMWLEVEERTNMKFFARVTLIPRIFFVCASIICFFLWIVMSSFTQLITHGLPTSSIVAIAHIYYWCSFFFWSYGTGLIGGFWAIFLLTLHAHHFQLTLLKVRLEHDRLHNEDSVPQWKSCRLFVEEYLFHQQTVRKTSEAWQLCVITTLLCTFLYFVSALAGFVLYQSLTSLVLGMVCAIFFLMIIYFIASLNNELSNLKNIFVMGSAQDWKLYGGREELLKYVDSNPIVFSIFGFVITFKVLLGFASSIIGANFSAIVAVMGLRSHLATT